MKRISLELLLQGQKSKTYAEQYHYVIGRIEKDELRPVKSSPLNGKKPALHQYYWVVEQQKNYEELLEEIKYGLSTAIATDYYYKNPAVYEEERSWVLQLSRYLLESPTEPMTVSLNERSFQIWGREKFLQREQGKKILRHCSISLSQLKVYETSEPLSYYSSGRQIPQTILIIENKDTFFSMRRFLIENDDDSTRILNEPVQTLVYGAGKGILRSIEDFRFCVEPYMNDKRNQYLYFGDLDYEGIGIYERLTELLEQEHELVPFCAAYIKMLEKAEALKQIDMPDTKAGQNRNISDRFFSYFTSKRKEQMQRILEAEKYIPQEILNIRDF